MVEELSGGAVQRVYTYGLQRISESQTVNSTAQNNWYGYDGEGHVRTLTDSSGTITDSYDYDAFGNVIASTGTTPNLYRYRGEQFDSDLDLYYLRARWYNPVTGRFLSRDPLDTGNKYAYAGADPVNRRDPSEMLGESDIQLAADAAATAGEEKARRRVVCRLTQAASLLAITAMSVGDNQYIYIPITVNPCLSLPLKVPRPKAPVKPQPKSPPPRPGTPPVGPSQPNDKCNGHLYQVGTYTDLASLSRNGCPVHHVPQDA